MSEAAVICDYVRTPIGRYGGALSGVRTDDLAARPLQEILERTPAARDGVEEVLLGCANQAGEDNRNVARMALLLAGFPESTPGATVNRLCASGMEAVGAAARAIRTGELQMAVAGGVESMSRAPFVMAKAEKPFARTVDIHDTTLGWRFINPKMRKLYGVDSMAETGENVAAEHDISREAQDTFALRSQQRTAAAVANGFFKTQICPVSTVVGKGETKLVSEDEHPRPESSLEKLAKLPPITGPEGTITAGNASGINDGAAALLLASESFAKAQGLKIRAKVLGMGSAGVAPRVMGMGPVAATAKLLDRLGFKIGDMEVIELNEAFASQALACLRQWGVEDDAEHVNAYGGAIALGHPLGMSGARLVGTAVCALEERDATLALATMCVGVGQGVSICLERYEG